MEQGRYGTTRTRRIDLVPLETSNFQICTIEFESVLIGSAKLSTID